MVAVFDAGADAIAMAASSVWSLRRTLSGDMRTTSRMSCLHTGHWRLDERECQRARHAKQKCEWPHGRHIASATDDRQMLHWAPLEWRLPLLPLLLSPPNAKAPEGAAAGSGSPSAIRAAGDRPAGDEP